MLTRNSNNPVYGLHYMEREGYCAAPTESLRSVNYLCRFVSEISAGRRFKSSGAADPFG
jgi:hypothetical protein